MVGIQIDQFGWGDEIDKISEIADLSLPVDPSIGLGTQAAASALLRRLVPLQELGAFHLVIRTLGSTWEGTPNMQVTRGLMESSPGLESSPRRPQPH